MVFKKIRDAALDWAATAASTSGVLSSLLTFEVVQRIAIRRGPVVHQKSVSAMAWAINRAYRLTGGHTSAEGIHHAVPGRPYIIVSNHQSMFDISLISEYLAHLQPRYVSKRENARRIPGVSYNLRKGGSALIDRRDPEQAREVIASAARRMLREGWSMVIFPEGTRSRDGRLKTFREGGLRTLIEHAPGVEVLPVTTSGGWRVFERNLKPVVRNVELHLKVHAPIAAPDPADRDAFKTFVARVQDIIRGGLAGGEGGAGMLPQPA
jgi:1-acyl-sn-glycerol-3-phosphate acyltransferase